MIKRVNIAHALLSCFGLLCVLMVSFVTFSDFASATCTTDSTTGDVTCTDSASATVHVSEACTMNATLNTPHIAEMTNGLYQTNIGKTTLNVVCNDASGFSIYAVGYTNDEFGNNKLLTSSIEQDAPIINTGTSSSGSNSTWSMKLTPVSNAYAPTLDNSFNDYHDVPTTYTKVAHKSSGTDAGTNPVGSSIEATYAAYISGTQPAGTYTGQVKYTLVHPMANTPQDGPQVTESGKICYYANANDVEGTMGCQTVSASATSATLLASNFSRDGYGFAGWSDAYDYETNPNANFYGPQEYITFTAGQYTGSNPGLSLYAHWVKSAGALQGWTCPNNTNMPIGSVTALTDLRDNDTYAVAKLADGNCWMIENLRLESTNSDNSTGALAQGYGTSATYGNFSGLADAESTGFSSTYSANSLYSNDGSNDTINISASNYPAYRMPRYNNINTSARASNPTRNGNSMYSYGNYYTWHAAIADLTYNGTSNQSTTGTSLCPKGWHLPTGGLAYASGNTGGVNVTGDTSTFREFYNLGYTIMGSNTTAYEDTPNSGASHYSSSTTNANGDTATKAFRKYPNNFIYSGYFNGSSADYRGNFGYYWSSTASGYSYARFLHLDNSLVYPGTGNSNKYYGQSIRCLSSS